MANFIQTDGKTRNGKTITKATKEQMVYITDNICPICNQHFVASDFLAEIFADDPKARFIANLVTHYRHNHLQSWNRCWGLNGKKYRRKWYSDYDDEKQEVNERAKRQIIRKATEKLIALGIGSNTFKKLQNTDGKTIALAEKKLDTQISFFNLKTQE